MSRNTLARLESLFGICVSSLLVYKHFWRIWAVFGHLGPLPKETILPIAQWAKSAKATFSNNGPSQGHEGQAQTWPLSTETS